MNTTQPIVIDEVKTGEIAEKLHSEVLELEWFEIKKQKLTRATSSGLVLELRLPHQKEWRPGDSLYSNGKLIAIIVIKACLTICFSAADDQETADFCYFIGNQHLPIFLTSNKQFAVPYDGRLYEQLSLRYGRRIELTETPLLPTQSLRHLNKNKAYEH